MGKERMDLTRLEYLATKGMHDACKIVKNSFLGKLFPFTYQLTRQNFLKHSSNLAYRRRGLEFIYKPISEVCACCSQDSPQCYKVDKILKQYEEYLKKLDI